VVDPFGNAKASVDSAIACRYAPAMLIA